MMIRYLFVFGYMYRKIVQALETKAFDPFDRNLPYRYRMRQIGYTIGTMFIRSYEQGERVYTSMLCRGYGRQSHLFYKEKRILKLPNGHFSPPVSVSLLSCRSCLDMQFSLF